MSDLRPPRDLSIPITKATLDLASPMGDSFDGLSRLVVNMIVDNEGGFRRIGGFKRLGSGNGDLHDQLLSAIASPLPAAQQTLEVYNHPKSTSYLLGSGFGFFVEAAGGEPPYEFQWQKNSAGTWLDVVDSSPSAGQIMLANSSGSTAHSFFVWSATGSASGLYRCKVTDSADSVVYSRSAVAATDLSSPYTQAPRFIVNPSGASIPVGGSHAMSVVVDGEPAPSLQWQVFSGGAWVNLSGETSATLSIESAEAADSGDYRCVATNSAGTAESSVASMVVASGSGGYGDVHTHIDSFVCGQNNQLTYTVTNPRNDQTMTVQWGSPSGVCANTLTFGDAQVVVSAGGSAGIPLAWDLVACNSGAAPPDFLLYGSCSFSGGAPGFTIFITGTTEEACNA